MSFLELFYVPLQVNHVMIYSLYVLVQVKSCHCVVISCTVTGTSCHIYDYFIFCCRFLAVLSPFHATVEPQVKKLRGRHAFLKQNITDTIQFYGESPKDMKMEALFNAFGDLADEITKVERKMEAAAAREGTGDYAIVMFCCFIR